MLKELRDAHDETLRHVEALERALRGAPPARDELAALRWRLTRASGQRRKLLDAIYPMLRDLGGADAARVRALRDEQSRLLAFSSRHITHWTIDRIYADWPGYQHACARIVEGLRARIGRERATLYHLLGPTAVAQVA